MKISVCVNDWPMLTVSFPHRSCNVVFSVGIFMCGSWMRAHNVNTYKCRRCACWLLHTYHIHIENSPQHILYRLHQKSNRGWCCFFFLFLLLFCFLIFSLVLLCTIITIICSVFFFSNHTAPNDLRARSK